MKSITFTITHDRLRHGDFPVAELTKLGVGIITTKKAFKEEVIVSMEIDNDEDEYSTIYELGALVGAILANNNYK